MLDHTSANPAPPLSAGTFSIDCGVCVLRPFRAEDAPSLAELANDRDIWINVRDRFPHPYRLEHAEKFIADALTKDPPANLAITVDGRAVGSIGVIVGVDIERVSAELGYWLGKPYWGRGIATAAITAMTTYAIERFGLTRIFASVFTYNPASGRALEKAGYTVEAFQRRAVIKDGAVHDQRVYAFYA